MSHLEVIVIRVRRTTVADASQTLHMALTRFGNLSFARR
jgi:hypothetical protein